MRRSHFQELLHLDVWRDHFSPELSAWQGFAKTETPPAGSNYLIAFGGLEEGRTRTRMV